MKANVWKITVMACLIGIILLMAGCGDEKTGGGGKQQPYDPGTGRYK